jgi:phage gp16-like protein
MQVINGGRGRSGDDLRKRELAQIHIAKQQLGLSDDEYRDVMFAVTRVRSAAELDWTGRKRLLDHFRKVGFKGGQARAAGGGSGGDRQVRLVRHLWAQLHAAGAVASADDAAMNAWIKRQFNRNAVQWLSTGEARSAIEQLKRWLARTQQAKDAAAKETA